MPILVGTSGWQYRDWRGVLYPPGLAQGSWLQYYAGQYGTVENNGSFYRLPSRGTFEGAARPWPRYGERALRSWVQRVAETWPGDADIFAHFNNDQGGAAVHDAAAFAAIAPAGGDPADYA